ncbi:hypothetical protein Dsin_001316 [Dipteronia sinensis]|uniref:Uncharacterized protein n=1 Tax=Dipteronia sinensis TaxID=43782 RepID=A0AAE0EK69_9ROSI|nr:hypothetical protein Dsin_001316 [Dipteronia sinensis]
MGMGMGVPISTPIPQMCIPKPNIILLFFFKLLKKYKILIYIFLRSKYPMNHQTIEIRRFPNLHRSTRLISTLRCNKFFNKTNFNKISNKRFHILVGSFFNPELRNSKFLEFNPEPRFGGYMGLSTAIFTDVFTALFAGDPSKFIFMLAGVSQSASSPSSSSTRSRLPPPSPRKSWRLSTSLCSTSSPPWWPSTYWATTP